VSAGGDPAESFNRGEHREAHEVWEALWRAEVDPLRRRRLQGLAQVAAAMIKAAAGQRAGAERILARARAHLEAAGSGEDPWDVPQLLRALDDFVRAPGNARVNRRSVS
jgi:predicted metal-dependent hydrolase